MLPGFVERHLLIEHPFDGPHHRFKAMHPKGEGFMWLVVSLLLLINTQKVCWVREFMSRQNRVNATNKEHIPAAETNLDLKHLSLISSAGPHHIIS